MTGILGWTGPTPLQRVEGLMWLVGLGSVWLPHIGMDRLVGYGLKYPDSFHHTHLGMIGPAKRAESSR